MQTLSEIRQILQTAGLKPQKRFGQNFLIDKNLLSKLLELAGIQPHQIVLEIGPGTGSLTEELLLQAGRVVAVEIDSGLAQLLGQRLTEQKNFRLIHGDVLAAKHRISPEVLEALGKRAVVVANLPYNLATPFLAECLVGSWRAVVKKTGCRFDALTVTVQKELADRLVAGCTPCRCRADYGPISVLVALLGQVTLGPHVPATAFWPRPKVDSRIVRIDFNLQAAKNLFDVEALQKLLQLAFGQRRKQLTALLRIKQTNFSSEVLAEAFTAAGVDTIRRCEQLEPETFALIANALTAKR